MQSVFSPAARPRWREGAQAADPRRWAKNVLDETAGLGVAPAMGIECRAFLARRRGRGGARALRLRIRGGGLKTCWTKPQGWALPQLWALQLGKGFRERDRPATKCWDRGFARAP